MKTSLKIFLLAAVLGVMTACSAQRRAERQVRKAVALCPELVQVKAHPVDTVLTVHGFTDAVTVQLTDIMRPDTIYRAAEHGTFVVSRNISNGEVRIGYIAMPQKLRYCDTLHYRQVVLPPQFAQKAKGGFWSHFALILNGIGIGVALGVWLRIRFRKR